MHFTKETTPLQKSNIDHSLSIEYIAQFRNVYGTRIIILYSSNLRLRRSIYTTKCIHRIEVYIHLQLCKKITHIRRATATHERIRIPEL